MYLYNIIDKNMIVQKEIDEQQVVDIVNNLIPDLSGDIAQIESDILSLQVSQGIQDGLIDQNTNDINTIELEQTAQNN